MLGGILGCNLSGYPGEALPVTLTGKLELEAELACLRYLRQPAYLRWGDLCSGARSVM